MAKKTIEKLLTEKVAVLEREVQVKQEMLAQAQQQLDDYNKNKAVIETILALKDGGLTSVTVAPGGKKRGRKPKVA
jgi:hypothetical protein